MQESMRGMVVNLFLRKIKSREVVKGEEEIEEGGDEEENMRDGVKQIVKRPNVQTVIRSSKVGKTVTPNLNVEEQTPSLD